MTAIVLIDVKTNQTDLPKTWGGAVAPLLRHLCNVLLHRIFFQLSGFIHSDLCIMLFNHDNFRGGGISKSLVGGGTLLIGCIILRPSRFCRPGKCKKNVILLIVIDLFSCYIKCVELVHS